MYRYFKKIIGVGSTDYIYFLKSKALPDENISPSTKISYFGTKTRVEFNGSCLRQDKITYTHGKIIKI